MPLQLIQRLLPGGLRGRLRRWARRHLPVRVQEKLKAWERRSTSRGGDTQLLIERQDSLCQILEQRLERLEADVMRAEASRARGPIEAEAAADADAPASLDELRAAGPGTLDALMLTGSILGTAPRAGSPPSADVLAQAFRVLRPGGALVLLDRRAPDTAGLNPAHAADLCRAAADAGLEVLAIEYRPTPPAATPAAPDSTAHTDPAVPGADEPAAAEVTRGLDELNDRLARASDRLAAVAGDRAVAPGVRLVARKPAGSIRPGEADRAGPSTDPSMELAGR